MRIYRTLFSVALVAALAVTVSAQQRAQGGYHVVACVKVKREKDADYRKFVAEGTRKFYQARVDSGDLSGWILLHSIMPQGESAECDYLSVSLFPAAPPRPLSADEVGPVLKKAGVAMTQQEFFDRRNALSELVSSNLFQNQASVGSFKKGNYAMVNYMKVPNVDDWLAYEKKVWQPLAEALVKDGKTSGWSVNVQVLPGGADLPFQAVTVDIYPDWDSIFKDDPQFVDRFKRVHSDMELGTTLEEFGKLRTIKSTQLFEVIEAISK